MSQVPIQPTSSYPVEGAGPDPRRSGAFRFWRNFAQANEAECREALEFLGEIRGEDYSGLAREGSSTPESGKFVMIDVPVTSPKNARDAWNADRVTTLVRVDPEVHCLAFDGDDRKHDGGEFFVACSSTHPLSTGPEACTIGTHSKPNRVRVELEGPAYMVKVRASSAATKPKVLAGILLYEKQLPEVLLECGLGEALQEYVALPRVWRFVLELYPGPKMMLRFMEGDTEDLSKKYSEGSVSGDGGVPGGSRSGMASPVPSQVGGIASGVYRFGRPKSWAEVSFAKGP